MLVGCKRPIFGTLSHAQAVFFCFQVLGMDEVGAVAQPHGRRRLVLVEQRRLGCATGRRESQRPLVSLERKRSSDAAQTGL